METKHTPGPWEVWRGDVWSADDRLICNPSRQREVGKGLANARLIAASPNLLAALINLRHGSDLPGEPALVAMQEAADAAIAKALGTE